MSTTRKLDLAAAAVAAGDVLADDIVAVDADGSVHEL